MGDILRLGQGKVWVDIDQLDAGNRAVQCQGETCGAADHARANDANFHAKSPAIPVWRMVGEIEPGVLIWVRKTWLSPSPPPSRLTRPIGN